MYKNKGLKKNKIEANFLQNLEKEHIKYLKQKAWEKYERMTNEKKAVLDREFPKWWAERDPFSMFIFGNLYPIGIKKFYLAEMLLSRNEFDFIDWAKKQGYIIDIQNKFTLLDIIYGDDSSDDMKKIVYEEMPDTMDEFDSQDDCH